MSEGQAPQSLPSTGSNHEGALVQAMHATGEEDVIIFDDSSDADVSVSASDVETEENDSQQRSAGPVISAVRNEDLSERLPLGSGGQNGKKRKFFADGTKTLVDSEPLKKVKLKQERTSASTNSDSSLMDKSLLPAAIWHYIFTLAQPRGLGTLLQVSKLFKSYLDPSSSTDFTKPLPGHQGRLSTLQPDTIWRASRKRYWPKMPAPLKNKTELDMWRLVRSRRCQFCGKGVDDNLTAAKTKSSPGPGVEGVRLMWPFGITSCGSCLMANTIKEIDLLVSSSIPHLLLQALPFVFITSDLQAFTPGALSKGFLLKDVSLTKLFSTKQVHELKEEFLSVKHLGAGAAEEWLKGLENRGKEMRLDAERWEKWDSKGGLQQVWLSEAPARQLVTATRSSELRSKVENNAINDESISNRHHVETLVLTTDPTPNSNTQPILSLQIEETGSFSDPHPSLRPTQLEPTQSKRSIHEVLELKASRRAEIERRAMLLDPPLQPDMLAQIPSFQAALQIITPLDDNAWEMLKPRLLLQRVEAEQRETRNQSVPVPPAPTPRPVEEHRMLEGQGKETKELMDKDWDDAQAPLRAQISMYADEFIRDAWEDGNKVNKDLSPCFAVEVLLHVRKKFYAKIEKDAAIARAAGKEPKRDPPMGPFTQKLTLENMKWLFEVKVKPHTEAYRKELFLCNGCEDSLKAYGFEGVVQHYAAKHTSCMSVGSIVVYWRSEWPEIPPFHPDPVARDTQFGKSSNLGLSRFPALAQQHDHQHHVQSAYTVPIPPHTNPEYHGLYGHSERHFQHIGFVPPTTYHTTHAAYNPLFPHQPLPYTQGYGMPNSAAPALAGPQAQPACPPQFGSRPLPPGPIIHYNHNYYDAYQPNGYASYPGLQSHPPHDRMRTQLETLAHFSRDIWMATAGVKELPGYIRVYVCFYHLAKRYRSHFTEDPPLGMFNDGLSNHKEMRPVRNVNGLQCKACNLRLANYTPIENERRVFSLPQLVNHFQQKHLEPLQNMGQPLLDWTVDMIFLPEVACLTHLNAMVGMDGYKYGLIVEAFPQVSFSGPSNAEKFPRSVATPYDNHIESIVAGQYDIHTHTYNDGPHPATTSDAPVSRDINSSQQHVGTYMPLPFTQPLLSSDSSHATGNHGHASEAGVATPSDGQGQTFLPYSIHKSGSHRTKTGNPEWPAGRQRNHKLSGKERRAGQGGKSRKGGAKDGAKQSKTATEKAESEEDKEAEAEAQRQEEAIRAMWAADRQAAARVTSDAVQPQNSKPKTPDQSLQGNIPTHTHHAPKSSLVDNSRPITETKVTSKSPAVRLDQEDDLFASLESHLDQQLALKTTSTVLADTGSTPEQEYMHGRKVEDDFAQNLPRQRDRLHSPARVGLGEAPLQQQHQQQLGYSYHNRTPPTNNSGPIYVRADDQAENAESSAMDGRSSRSLVDDHVRVVSGEFNAIYTDVSRSHPESLPRYADSSSTGQVVRSAQPRVSYTEVWERVLVRDSHGDEYYIERPIRRERDPIYIRYEDEHPSYCETMMAYRGHEQDNYRGDPLYGSHRQPGVVDNHEIIRGSMSTRAESPRRRVPPDDAQRALTSSFEEYDPKFPSAPSSFQSSRQVRY